MWVTLYIQGSSVSSISSTFKILKMLLTTVLSLIISAYINNKVAAERLLNEDQNHTFQM